RLEADIDDLAVEDRRELGHLRAHLGGRLHRHHHQLALDAVARRDLGDLDDRDQLVELLHHLLERRRFGVDDDGHAAESLVVGRADREREDVERAPREQPCDARQHARLVLDGDGEDVMVRHGYRPPSPNSGPRMMLSLDPPAGTIGYTFSRQSVRKSITTGRSSTSFAFSIVVTTSSAVSTRMPTQPIASAHFT